MSHDSCGSKALLWHRDCVKIDSHESDAADDRWDPAGVSCLGHGVDLNGGEAGPAGVLSL